MQGIVQRLTCERELCDPWVVRIRYKKALDTYTQQNVMFWLVQHHKVLEDKFIGT